MKALPNSLGQQMAQYTKHFLSGYPVAKVYQSRSSSSSLVVAVQLVYTSSLKNLILPFFTLSPIAVSVSQHSCSLDWHASSFGDQRNIDYRWENTS